MNANELEVALEELVDAASLRRVISALSDVAFYKGEHITSTWQDEVTAKVWFLAGHYLAKLAKDLRI